MSEIKSTPILIAGFLFLAGSVVAQTTNTVPFTDSFEGYAAGQSIDGTNGWSGSGTVTNLSYVYDSVSNGFPVAGSHTNILDFSGGITNRIDGAGSSVVWVDSVINAQTYWPGPGHPAVDTNANACIYVNTNGNLVAGHTQYGASNLVWSVFSGVAISSNDWNRITLQLDYRSQDTLTGHLYYAVMLNGVYLTHAAGRSLPSGGSSGGAWLPMIGTFPFSAVALDGEARADDFSVTETAPYASVSVADAGDVTEGDSGTTLADFTIFLSTTSSVPVTVDYATADGTAVAGTDYIAQSGTLTIPAGSLQAVIGVEVIGDTETESDVGFTLNLSSPVNTLVADASGAAVVVDDDIVVSADLMITGSTIKIVDGAPGSPSGGVTNFIPAGAVDWGVWDSTSIVPNERKAGGGALSGFSSSHSWAAASGNRIFMAWTDGSPTAADINFSGLAMTDAGQDVAYSAMDFSVGLEALEPGGYYRLTLYMTDKRNNSAFKYWDAGSSSFAAASTETDNDAADLRIHEMIISNVTVSTTLPVQISGKRTGSGFPVVLGGVVLERVGSVVLPPEQLPYDGWADAFGLSGSNALMGADADSSGFNNLYEYALGGNPTNAGDNGTEPVHGLNGGQMEYIYLRRSDTNVSYSVVVSTNLVSGSWSTNGVMEVGTASFDADFDSVTNLISTAGKTNGYIRLQIESL
jgi:hypothetical protein